MVMVMKWKQQEYRFNGSLLGKWSNHVTDHQKGQGKEKKIIKIYNLTKSLDEVYLNINLLIRAVFS